jgi:hypothetical protein
MTALRIFDGHNDSVQRIQEYRLNGIDFLARSTDGGALHPDLHPDPTLDPDWPIPSHLDLLRAIDWGSHRRIVCDVCAAPAPARERPEGHEK